MKSKRPKIGLIALTSLLVLLFISLASATSVAARKITICHKPNSPAMHTLNIALSAWHGHVGHGDWIGGCDDDDCDDDDDSAGGGNGGDSGTSVSATGEEDPTGTTDNGNNAPQWESRNRNDMVYLPPEEPGPGSTICRTDWKCSDWGECSAEGTRTRICLDINECPAEMTIRGKTYATIIVGEPKPSESKACSVEDYYPSVESGKSFLGSAIDNVGSGLSKITGRIVGGLSKGGSPLVTIPLFILWISIVLMAVVRRRKQSKK